MPQDDTVAAHDWRRAQGYGGAGTRVGGAADTLAMMFLVGGFVLLIAEVAAFVAVAEQIGFWWAILMLLAVSALGPFMIRRVGIGVLTRTQRRLTAGELPTSDLLDGVVVLLGGVLICVPGFITDAIGLLFMVGPVRRLFTRAAGRRVAQRIRTMSPRRWQVINVSAHGGHGEEWKPPQAPREMLGRGPGTDA